jgi:hypothetical protein
LRPNGIFASIDDPARIAFVLSRRCHEPFKTQGEPVSIGEVLGAIREMYCAAMEPLQGFEHRAIVLPEQALGYMEPVVGIDADQMSTNAA